MKMKKFGGTERLVYDLVKPIAEDAADPISQAYVLEVGSAGLERELNQPQHFTDSIGMDVRARAIRPINGEKEWIGVLQDFDETGITLLPDGAEEPVTLALEDLSYVRRYVAVEF